MYNANKIAGKQTKIRTTHLLNKSTDCDKKLLGARTFPFEVLIILKPKINDSEFRLLHNCVNIHVNEKKKLQTAFVRRLISFDLSFI
jgi:hypothetical protein